MMFKDFIKKIYLFNILFRWLKKQYILRYIAQKGFYFEFEKSALQSKLIPFLRGYCLWRNDETLTIEFKIGDYTSPAILFSNQEIEKRYINLNNTGFFNLLNPTEIPANEELIVIFKLTNGLEKRYPTGWILDDSKKQEFINQKKHKLESIWNILICPSCKSDKITLHSNVIKCESCSSSFKANNNHYNFFNQELHKTSDFSFNQNISANNYDQEAQKIIETYKNGLILDNGSGLRGHYYENVVNFEITDYPTTDVIGVGEHLPFKDETFDAVFSLNVLEHVRNPFLYASELKRVVKKGGIIYAAAPFLQPYHGFPYHFFNMTPEGLRILFEDTRIIKTGVVEMGHPLFSISWILDEYIKGLSERDKRKFLKLKVKDLLKDPVKQLEINYAKNLSAEAKRIISSVNFVLCEKK